MGNAFFYSFWIYVGISAGLVLIAGSLEVVAGRFLTASLGLMSGLTMGLMSLDMMNLEILKNSGTDSQRKYASRIIPLVTHHHLLLVTLLLANSAVCRLVLRFSK